MKIALRNVGLGAGGALAAYLIAFGAPVYGIWVLICVVLAVFVTQPRRK